MSLRSGAGASLQPRKRLFTLSLVFRHHVEKKRSVAGSKDRLERDVLGQRLRIYEVTAKNDRRSREVRRPSFGRTPKRGWIGPAKAGLYMHVPGRAEPRRLAARGVAHPYNEM
jgi:hypothetical protein